ncbi:hypothetical protein [uncultured Allofournierella sp.]|uniref:hypothetical protein n=1 Tax=uncultured Allofournierella sp. TaxID=1940258 RepID=UPI0025CDF33B|nr:hypothetical protein [uncultured Fournierella sp.]
MTSELWLLCCMGMVLLLTAGLAFLWAIFYDRCAREKQQLQTPDFTAKAGFKVTQLPGAPYLRLDRVYLLGRRVGQLEFFIQPNWTAVLRVAPESEELRLWELGLPEYDQLTVRPVSGVRTELRQAPGGSALACWQRDGFCYGLYLPAGEMGLAGSLLERFAADCRCAATR